MSEERIIEAQRGRERSEAMYADAIDVMPGGVNSPVRAFGAVGGTPLFMESGHGPWITDVDGNRYLDYVGSWGPFILGHNHPAVMAALREQLEKGTSFGAPSALEVEIALLLTNLIPGLDMLRLVSSGTEATMSAVRVARGATGRRKLIKFEGCYHGHGDSFLIKGGSGMLTHGVPTSPGVTPGTADDTLVAGYNDIESVKALFAENRNEIAAVIIEPIAGNMGVVPSDPDMIRELRALCSEEGALLIFDEVMTGFRVALRGAAEIYDVVPDLVTYGKIIGGGLPVGAYGGRRALMEQVSPVGPIYQAGTLSGNPLAVAAGMATLGTLMTSEPYALLEMAGARLEQGLRAALDRHGITGTINRIGSMITLFFADGPIATFADAMRSDTARYARFFHGMLDRGYSLPPSQFEAWFLSILHNDELIDATIAAADEVLAEMAHA